MIGGKNRIKGLVNKRIRFKKPPTALKVYGSALRKVSAQVVVIEPRGNLV
jgi:hypothetical protein